MVFNCAICAIILVNLVLMEVLKRVRAAPFLEQTESLYQVFKNNLNFNFLLKKK